MKEIILTQGKVALVDDADFEWLNGWKWYAGKNGKIFYAQRATPRIEGKKSSITMHVVILGKFPKGFISDHKDGNGLNNQRNNLRYVTRRQNIQNLHNMERSSEYPGICWHKQRKKWQATIEINKTRKHLGLFINEKEAFEVYREAIENLGQTVIDYD